MAASSTTPPSPYLFPITSAWDGIDGSWTSFSISVGSPQQNFRVLISTRGSSLLVPTSDFCNSFGPGPKCPESLGVQPFGSKDSRGFAPHASHTWDSSSNLTTIALEHDLAYQGEGPAGKDTVHLGYDTDKGALKLDKALVTGVNPGSDYFMGLLGLSPYSQQLEGKTMDSFITRLKEEGQIPSSSYGYTAGARYQNGDKGVFGGLVLGGYDQSRFNTTPTNFTFAMDKDQPLKVIIQSITTSESLDPHGQYDLLPRSIEPKIWSDIDSTVPHLWLPVEVCERFEKAFGLIWDNSTKLYPVNDTLHKDLIKLDPSITFHLGNTNTPNTTAISLPYTAFDLWKMPLDPDTPQTRYFPLRRAANDSQITLGRVLLQEAYLIVDHERKNFSLTQAVFTDPMPSADIRTIFSRDATFPSHKPHHLSPGTTAGIAIAAVLGLLLTIAAAILFRSWRRTPSHTTTAANGKSTTSRSRNASLGATSLAPTYAEKYDSVAGGPPGYTPLPGDAGGARGRALSNESEWVEMPAAAVERGARRPELEGSASYEMTGTGSGVHEMEAGVASGAEEREKAGRRRGSGEGR